MLIDGFPAVTKAADQFEIGKDLSGLIVRDGAGKARSGVFYRGPASATLLTPRTDMAVDAQAFEGVAERRGGVIFTVNDGATPVPLTRPTANSHIALIYWKQRVAASPWSDGADGPIFGVVYGDPASIPQKPALNIEGAVEIGTVQIPSSATSTSSSGVIITTTAPYTTTVGSPIPVRNQAERNAIFAFQNLQVFNLAIGAVEVYFAAFDAVTNPTGSSVAGWRRAFLAQMLTWAGPNVDNAVQYPPLATDAANSTDSSLASTWARGISLRTPGSYALLTNLSYAVPSQARGFLQIGADNDPIRARSTLGAGEDRATVTVPVITTTAADRQVEIKFYKQNGNLGQNSISVLVVKLTP